MKQLTMKLQRFSTLFESIDEFDIEGAFEPQKMPRPTTEEPGPGDDGPYSGKVAVLRRRLERGEEMWHPDDPVVVPPPSRYDEIVGAFGGEG